MYESFGPSAFAARFWSAVFGIGGVLLTYRLGRLMFSPVVGFYSGLILASCVYYNVISWRRGPRFIPAILLYPGRLAICRRDGSRSGAFRASRTNATLPGPAKRDLSLPGRPTCWSTRPWPLAY